MPPVKGSLPVQHEKRLAHPSALCGIFTQEGVVYAGIVLGLAFLFSLRVLPVLASAWVAAYQSAHR